MRSQFKNNVLTFVLAGGRGKRLHPLTLERTKPSVPFGGKYRVIDFTLSNLINSHFYAVYVLVQYKSQSLIEHIRTSWRRLGDLPEQFITVVPPQMRKESFEEWYRGTADSIYQNINLIYDFKPKFVVIFGGDHVYRMNIKEMLDYHIQKKAELTLSVIPTQHSEAHKFGIPRINSNMRVTDFAEKPDYLNQKNIYASMGNYIFNTGFLIESLNKCKVKNEAADFGKNIIPYLIQKKRRVFAYDFSQNNIPFLNKYEAKYYWKDVGSIVDYWQANMDLLGNQPVLNLDNHRWPIYASNLCLPPAYVSEGQIENSLICGGSKIIGSKVKNSIIGRSVFIEKGCKVEDSIIMDFTRIGKSCRIKKTIIDRFNTIPRNTDIGYNPNRDSQKYYRDPSGIVAVKRGTRGFQC